MSIKLVALDIDDTLLNSHGEILDSTQQAIKTALDRGIKIVLCSGRPLAGVKPYLDQLAISGNDQYVVTYNGAVVCTADGEVLAKELLDNDQYRRLTIFGEQHQVPFNVLDEHSVIYTADRNIDFVTVVQAWENLAGIMVRQLDELPNDFQITKGAFVGDPAKLDQIQSLVEQTFGHEMYIVRAGKQFLELMNPKVNKGQALKELTQQIGISPAEVMVIGDEGNDLTMFEFAGLAVCMGNGSAEAKAQADFVTSTNDDNGIALALNKFIWQIDTNN